MWIEDEVVVSLQITRETHTIPIVGRKKKNTQKINWDIFCVCRIESLSVQIPIASMLKLIDAQTMRHTCIVRGVYKKNVKQ